MVFSGVTQGSAPGAATHQRGAGELDTDSGSQISEGGCACAVRMLFLSGRNVIQPICLNTIDIFKSYLTLTLTGTALRLQ